MELLPPPREHIELKTWALVKIHHRCSQREVYIRTVISTQKPHQFVLSMLAPRHTLRRWPCLQTLYQQETDGEVTLHYMISEMNWELCALCPLIYLVKNVAVKMATTCQKCPICPLTEKDNALFPVEETGAFLTTFIPPNFCWCNYSFQFLLILWPLKTQKD